MSEDVVAAITTVDPATGEPLEQYPYAAPAELERALARAADAFARWRRTSVDDRSLALSRLGRALEQRREEAAALITREMGKTVREARAELDKCVWACDHYAEHGARYLASEQVATEWNASYVRFLPLGPVLAVMPWNYPFWQVLRFAAPTLMAGNAIVLKHAANVTGCALLLARIAEQAELPAGLVQAPVMHRDTVAPMIADPRIAAVTLTGSDVVGAKVAETCGRHLKPSVLELGGSDPFIVLEDADVTEAARTAVAARFQNCGQSCIAAKRFIVVEQVADEFERRFAQAAAALVVGDPFDAATDLGPMARADLRDELAEQVRRSVAAGGRVVVGGPGETGPAAFHPATLVADVRPGDPLLEEETFGPVAALARVPDENAAVALANASPFGLSSSIWTADVRRGEALGARLETGAVFVNAMTASDPRMPFGGVKRSGWGRELGMYGIREFTNVQAVTSGPRAAA